MVEVKCGLRGQVGVRRRVLVIAGAAFALGIVACGDGDSPSTKSAPDVSVTSKSTAAYSVKGFLVKGGKRIPAKFGPTEHRTNAEIRDQKTAQSNASVPGPPSQKTQVAPNRCLMADASCSPADFSAIESQLKSFDGEVLLMAVADSCVREQRGPYQWPSEMVPTWPNLTEQIDAAVSDPSDEAALSSLPRVWTRVRTA